MKILRRALALLAALGFWTQVQGHHSAAQFDFSKSVTVEGKVTLIEVRNPHIKLIMEVPTASGGAKEIEYEGHSRNNVFRRGWRPDDVKVGDQLTIGIAPLRDGSDEGGYITSFKLAGGKEF
jgi:hypothetical protein